MSQKVVLDRN